MKEDNEIVKIVAEQKIRSMRLAGQMLESTELNKGTAESSGNQYVPPQKDELRPTLSDLGLTKNESSTYQKLASIPDDVFEDEMEKAKQGMIINTRDNRSPQIPFQIINP